MEMIWPLAIVVVTGVALGVVYVLGARLFSSSQHVTRAFWCPFRRQNVHVGFAASAWDGRLADVEHCSAFTPPSAPTCDKACVALPALPQMR
jgi:hypothetical protein